MPIRLSAGLALACLPFLLLAACSGSAKPTPTPTDTPTVLNLRPILGSSDLAVGKNRLVFALLDATSAPVQASSVKMSLGYVQDKVATPQGTVMAAFRPWPVGPGGVFVAEVDFSRPGQWLAELTPTDGDAAGELARLVIPVSEHSITPALGAPAPATVNRTGSDAATLEKITSDLEPDPDLYAVTIAEAERSGKPTVVAFATPAFCTSRTCGPQVDVVKQLKNAYKGQGNFIHVELYANPQEMRTDLSKGMIAPAVEEWRLPSDPWTFVLDRQGKVAAKFEAFVSYEELETAFKQALG